jgi:molybdate transport system ATP-binding protein
MTNPSGTNPSGTSPAATNASSADAPATLRFRATKMLHTAHGPRMLDIAFEWQQGRLLAVYGPSGAGKTTLLRILAGLTEVVTGHIEVDGDTWLDSTRKIHVPTRRRSIGFVFQDFALFPNLNVRQQLEFALPKKGDRARVDELLSLMELEQLQQQRPARLSGGQQQRIAIARAIARRPGLLLLDEPLSALDDEMRHKLQEYILKVHRHYQLTTILVSHYAPEVLRLADGVILLENGAVTAQGAPADVFRREITGPPFPASLTPGSPPPTPSLPPAGPPFTAPAEIIRITPTGSSSLITVSCAGVLIDIPVSAQESTQLQPGQQVIVTSALFTPRLTPILP